MKKLTKDWRNTRLVLFQQACDDGTGSKVDIANDVSDGVPAQYYRELIRLWFTPEARV